MPRRARRLLLLLAAACAAAVLVGAAQATYTGPARLLVVRVTWGPEPFADDVVQDVVFNQTATFLNTSSFGRVTLTGAMTPWLHALAVRPACDPYGVAATARQAALAVGFNPNDYDRVAFLFPRLDCPWQGLGGSDSLWLNGQLYRKLVAHELGHTFGLSHARSWTCRGTCVSAEYGDPYDTMGSGDGDFNAFEKVQLGWITSISTAAHEGTYTIDRPDRPSTRPQALVVAAALTDYWFENRQEQVAAPPSSLLPQAPSFLPTGVLVRLDEVPMDPANAFGAVPSASYFLPDSAGLDSPALQPGQTFTLAKVFSVTIQSQLDGLATLAFRWLDRTPPTAPRVHGLARVVYRGGRLIVAWERSTELGSGVDRYDVAVDRRAAVQVRPSSLASPRSVLRMPAVGEHQVTVTAVDRAGNRSKPTVRRFLVRR